MGVALEYAAAIERLEGLVRSQPDNFEWHYRLGLWYGGAYGGHPMADAAMAEAYLERARELAGRVGDDGAMARVADALGSVCLSAGRAAEAAGWCRRAARIYKEFEAGSDWARVQFNLGNACCELQRWRRALVHYRRALRVRTRDKNAAAHAATLENMGTAWRHLPGRAAATRAIACYRRALAAAPSASVYNNLANAYLCLPAADEEAGRRYARLALLYFGRALRAGGVISASAQYNRAQAFLRLAGADPGALRSAAGCAAQAREAFARCGRADYAALAEDICCRLETSSSR